MAGAAPLQCRDRTQRETTAQDGPRESYGERAHARKVCKGCLQCRGQIRGSVDIPRASDFGEGYAKRRVCSAHSLLLPACEPWSLFEAVCWGL
eukprot:9179453-Alexandrium_andersonii.AAC.1